MLVQIVIYRKSIQKQIKIEILEIEKILIIFLKIRAIIKIKLNVKINKSKIFKILKIKEKIKKTEK